MSTLNNDIPSLLVDAGNQFNILGYLTDFTAIKTLISQNKFVNLEEHTGKTREELEAHSPGICDAYNTWVAQITDPNLTEERFKLTMEEVETMVTDNRPE